MNCDKTAELTSIWELWFANSVAQIMKQELILFGNFMQCPMGKLAPHLFCLVKLVSYHWICELSES